MPVGDITPASNVEFYLLDYPEDTGRRRGLTTYHQQKMVLMEQMAHKYLDCKITKVSFGKKFGVGAVHRYFQTAFATKRPGDVVVLYYEGVGTGKHEDYSWYFEQNPNQPVNAYSLIQQFVASRLNIMLLLDCRIPTRFVNKWGSCQGGNLEISARGELDQTAEKQIIEGEECDFTDNLVSRLQDFVQNIDVRRPGYRNFHAPTSIPLLMRRNKELCENPKRIFNKRTKAGDKRHVARFCIMPDHVRATGKITFHMRTIQDEDKDEHEDGSAEPEDEGYEEGSEESVDSQATSRASSQAVSDVSSDATSDAGGLFLDSS